MPTNHQQLLAVAQQTDRALIYNGRQYRTQTIRNGTVFTGVGLIEVGPTFGTGPTVVSVTTGFRPKVLFIATAIYQSSMSGNIYVSTRGISYGITLDDNGNLVRYSFSTGRLIPSSYQTGDDNVRISSSPVSYKLYRLEAPGVRRLTALTGNVLSVNDAGFTIEVDNTYSYQITFFAIGGNVTVSYGMINCQVGSNTSAGLPFDPDSLFLLYLPYWNSELVYTQSTSGTSPSYLVLHHAHKLFYGKYNNQYTMAFSNHATYATTNQIRIGLIYYLPLSSGYSKLVNFDVSVSNQTLSFSNWSRSDTHYLNFVYVALSGLPIKIKRDSVTLNPRQIINRTITLDFAVDNLIFVSSEGEIAFDPHEDSQRFYNLDLHEGEITSYITINTTVAATKRLPGSGQYVYLTIYNSSSYYSYSGYLCYIQFSSDASTTLFREMTLFTSSWYRQYLRRAQRWAKLLSTISDHLVNLFYQSNRRTEMALELITQSEHLSELLQAWKKLLYVRGFSIAELFDTSWGRNLRPIRLLTPADIDVCPGDQLVLRLKVRHGNHDRNMRDMNDIVRMALLDYWTKTPVYWLGLGSGIEYDDEGQAVITIPWNVLSEALGRDRICRYRVELWPDERLGTSGWIVHVGTIREAK